MGWKILGYINNILENLMAMSFGVKICIYKNCLKFQLLHVSQNSVLGLTETTPRHVLKIDRSST